MRCADEFAELDDITALERGVRIPDPLIFAENVPASAIVAIIEQLLLVLELCEVEIAQ